MPTQTLTNGRTLSVWELSLALKGVVESHFDRVRVRGEISGVARPRSGHTYFTLKDDQAVLDAVLWRGQRPETLPEDGLEAILVGRLTTYPGRSRYQIVVEHIEPAGVGALLKQLDERRRRLAAEGLFENARSLPYLPRHIGVVTSPTGAVIRDILHRLRARCPVRVTLWPVKVQGQGAAEQIAAAVQGFCALEEAPDVLIVARGGGSLEDLWAFNEEVVVRAVAASAIPVVAAVGHESDTTLVDFAADVRAPTPSAAGEMVVPVLAEVRAGLRERAHRLLQAQARLLAQLETRTVHTARLLPQRERLLDLAIQRTDDAMQRMSRAAKTWFETQRQRVKIAAQLQHPPIELAHTQVRHAAQNLRIQPRLLTCLQRFQSQSQLLEALSHASVLRRGFVLVRQGSTLITRRAAAQQHRKLTLAFHDGELNTTVAPAPTPTTQTHQKKLL